MARLSFEEFSAGLAVQRAIPNAAPTPAKDKSTFDGTQGRLAEVGQSTANTITANLQGTGEFAGQTPLRRGVQATAAGFSAVPRGALALSPEPVRNVAESVGEAIGSGFRKLTSFIGSNPQLQKFVMENPDVTKDIEEITATLSAGGEIAGSILGGKGTAGTLQKASKFTQSTARTGVSAIESTLEAASNAGSRAGNVVQPATDIVRGIGSQVGNFARRTGTEAIDAAANNRRLSSLPEPEANIRRVVSDERVIDLTSKLTPEELAVTQRLVDQAKLKQGDITPNTAHPKEIAGQELLKPVSHIIDTRKQVGAQLGELRKQLGTQKNVNTNTAFRGFHTFLKENYGVQFDTQGNIIQGTGNLAKTDVPVIQDLYNELRSGTFMSQRQIDEFLQRSYKDYDLRQSREKTFSDDVSRIAEQARRDMRQLMPEQYNALATEYATLSQPLVDMVKLLNFKGNLDSLTAKDLKAGEVALRVLGNAADRPQSVIDKIVETANNAGYESSVNLNNIITMTDQLEGLYDITMPRSFAGQVSRGVDGSQAVGALGDAATLNVSGLYNRALQSRASQQEVRDAFESYLKSLSSQN